MKTNILIFLLSIWAITVTAQAIVVKGKVINEKGIPLNMVTIASPATSSGTTTDSTGSFTISGAASGFTLKVSHVGYHTQLINVKPRISGLLHIVLQTNTDTLKEVLVSTGYQQLPLERTTGSFVSVSSKIIDRKVSTDILTRLRDAVPGLIFNQVTTGNSTNPSISIRGTSTINGNPEPLIVVDNFPYEQDISNINPNDVESITVLKDAAAASIWGSRAGNGVIVITTKKGKYNQAPTINFNSNVTFSAKPDQFYLPRMSTADYIETEKKLFKAGYYSSDETSFSKPALTPVVELLIAQRDGTISPAEAEQQIDALKNSDVRDDFNRYLYRTGVSQQHALSLNGGTAYQKYFLSAGYDKNLESLVGNQSDRITLNGTNTYSFLNHKIDFSVGGYYTESHTKNNNPGTGALGLTNGNGLLYPYAQLADASGQPLAVAHAYRQSFVDSAAQKGLLDWNYRPLEEISLADNTSRSLDYRINTGLSYHLLPELSANITYQYGKTIIDQRNLSSVATFYARDLINNLTQVNSDGSLTRPIPYGGILDMANGSTTVQNFRGQLNYNKSWRHHDLNAIAGYEIRDSHNLSDTYRLYGYDPDHATSTPVDYVDEFPRYVNPDMFYSQILNNDSEVDLTDRFVSYYGNLGYTYDNRYQFTGSLRRDKSNLFGVNTNQKGVPLYSAGLGWTLSNEKFYKLSWLPFVKFKATYGYNGNVDKSISAYTTALYNSGSRTLTRQPYATIQNPPNPELRWEKVRIINTGIDFALKDNMITGSIEYYQKKGVDLIGNLLFPPSSGINALKGNFADTKGHGLDISLTSRNINQKIRWETTAFLSVVHDVVTKYESIGVTAASNLIDGGFVPNEGKPLYSLYSYRWAGLNPATGDPQGYLNGLPSSDYNAIKNAATKDNIVYNGSARPTTFGAILNTFSWNDLALSVNISYRFNYFFRRRSITYGTDEGLSSQNGDYEKRWQQPGDEQHTQVPGIPAAPDDSRDYFYTYSSILIEKADNIRLQDINLSYTFHHKEWRALPFTQLQVYAYANNVALLWTATKTGLDPDYYAGFPPVRTLAFGIKGNF